MPTVTRSSSARGGGVLEPSPSSSPPPAPARKRKEQEGREEASRASKKEKLVHVKKEKSTRASSSSLKLRQEHYHVHLGYGVQVLISKATISDVGTFFQELWSWIDLMFKERGLNAKGGKMCAFPGCDKLGQGNGGGAGIYICQAHGKECGLHVVGVGKGREIYSHGLGTR